MLVWLLSPLDITDYTVIDTEYWRETDNRLLTKTAYDYNNKDSIKGFPKNLSDWKGFDFKYRDRVYEKLNADIMLSRGYQNKNGDLIYLDIINSKTGESFHKQKICVSGAGWNVSNEVIEEFKIADFPNPFTKLYANRLDISKGKAEQVMIYWFMFKKFGSKDAVTMIRVSAPENYNEDTETTFTRLKDFIEGQLFDAMYQQGSVETVTNAENMVKEYGNKGISFIAIMLMIPISITIIGIIKNRSNQK